MGSEHVVPPSSSTLHHTPYIERRSLHWQVYIEGKLLCQFICEGHFTFCEDCLLWIYEATHSFQIRAFNPSVSPHLPVWSPERVGQGGVRTLSACFDALLKQSQKEPYWWPSVYS